MRTQWIACTLVLGACAEDGVVGRDATTAREVSVEVAAETAAETVAETVANEVTPPSSDFVPPTGLDPAAPPESPGLYRLLLATSSDGLAFTRTNTVLSDRANVPNMLVLPSGAVHVYYTGSGIDAGRDTSAVAISLDDGVSWAFKRIVWQGFEPGPSPTDPEVHFLPSGRLRIFMTQGIGNEPAIRWGDSDDGVTFSYGGIAWQRAGGIMDPQTIYLPGAGGAAGSWWMHALVPGSPDMLRATSTDGATFTEVGSIHPSAGGVQQFLSNAIALASGGFRVYAFNPGEGDIHSFSWSPPAEPVAESGVRLAHTTTSALESPIIKDAAVGRLASGGYLMVYATKIP